MRRVVRIGVVADTHVGEHLPGLPPSVATALEGVDLVLHAGDLTVPGVLDDLRAIAPVVAVRGNHDARAAMDGLPRAVAVRVGDARIGLTHGDRAARIELPAAVLSLLARRPVLLGFHRDMARRFRGADCVVVGHLHMPVHRRVGRTLVFSPGAVFVPERKPGYDWSGPRGAAYRAFRRSLPAEAREPAVGILEVAPGGGVTARRVPLEPRWSTVAA